MERETHEYSSDYMAKWRERLAVVSTQELETQVLKSLDGQVEDLLEKVQTERQWRLHPAQWARLASTSQSRLDPLL